MQSHKSLTEPPPYTKAAFSLIFLLDHIVTWQVYIHYKEHFSCGFSKRFAEKPTICDRMYKPKVEINHRDIYSGPWSTYLKMNTARLVPYGYVPAKLEVHRTENNRVIDPLRFSNCISLWPWPLPYGPENVRAPLRTRGYKAVKFKQNRTRNNGDIES